MSHIVIICFRYGVSCSSDYIAEVSLEPLLPSPLEHWDYKHVPLLLAQMFALKGKY